MGRQENIVDRFVRKIAEPFDAHNDCWIWTGAKTGSGYAQTSVNGKRVCAHRVAHELFIGPIPQGYQVDHLCKNRMCVRPDHLQALSTLENLGQWGRNKTHCRNGHPYDEHNIYRIRGERRCKICYRASQIRYQMRKEGK